MTVRPQFSSPFGNMSVKVAGPFFGNVGYLCRVSSRNYINRSQEQAKMLVNLKMGVHLFNQKYLFAPTICQELS